MNMHLSARENDFKFPGYFEQFSSRENLDSEFTWLVRWSIALSVRQLLMRRAEIVWSVTEATSCFRLSFSFTLSSEKCSLLGFKLSYTNIHQGKNDSRLRICSLSAPFIIRPVHYPPCHDRDSCL